MKCHCHACVRKAIEAYRQSPEGKRTAGLVASILAKRAKVFAALAAGLLLTSCASIHKTAPGWAAPVRIPAELTEPVPEPQLPEDATNGDLGEWAAALRDALREANERLRRIRGL